MGGVIDPRLKIIEEKDLNYIVVTSPKGGVGKTVISCALAISLSKYLKVGLLDLDITSPSCHVVLGIKGYELKEDRGVLPLEFRGIEFFSPILLGEYAVCLRGRYKSEAVLEILSMMNWRSKLIIVDTPPGMDDILMEIYYKVPRRKFLIVSTGDPLSLNSVKRIFGVLERKDIIGIIENMSKGDCKLSPIFGIKCLGRIPYYKDLEEWYGRFENSPLTKDVLSIVSNFKKDFLEWMKI